MSMTTVRNTSLFWAPVVDDDSSCSPSLLTPVTFWNMIWWSPFADLVLMLVGESRRGKPLNIQNKACEPYLQNSTLACTSLDDGNWMIKELFQEETYNIDCIQQIVEESEWIIDVGANIGTFAAWAAATRVQKYPNSDAPVSILCIEPVPATADACEINTKSVMDKHNNNSNNKTTTTNIQVARMGLGPKKDRDNKMMMTTFEDVPSASTTRPQDKFEANIKPLLVSTKAFIKYYKPFRPIMCTMISVLPFSFIRRVARELAIAFLWRWTKVPIKLAGLKDAFDCTFGHDDVPNKIDLLKVDVEGAELIVLESIEDDIWWPKIQCVIVEVHDLSNRCEKILELLQNKGFTAVNKPVNDYFNEEIGMNHFYIIATR